MRAAHSFLATAPGGVPVLRVDVSPIADVVSVRAAGEVDAFSGGTFEDACAAACAMEPTRLLIDLTAVTYFSASSVAILHRVGRRAASGIDGFDLVTGPGLVAWVVAALDRSPVQA